MGRRMVWMYEYGVTELNEKGKSVTKSVLSEDVPLDIDKAKVKKVRVAVYSYK